MALPSQPTTPLNPNKPHWPEGRELEVTRPVSTGASREAGHGSSRPNGSAEGEPVLHVNPDTGQWEVSIGHVRYGVIPGSAAERDLLPDPPYLADAVLDGRTSPPRVDTVSAHPPLDPGQPVRGLANQIIERRLGRHAHWPGGRELHALARPLHVFKKPPVPARFQASPEAMGALGHPIPTLLDVPSASSSHWLAQPTASAPRPRRMRPRVAAARRPSSTGRDASTQTLPGFPCQLCAVFSPDQRTFYFHLKTHYEDQSQVEKPPQEPPPPPPPPEEPDRFQARSAKGLDIAVADRPGLLSFSSKQSSPHPESPAQLSPPEPLFQCQQCRKGFRSQGALRVHARIHKDERPFPCDKCAKSFRQISDLNYHRQSLHSRRQSFACDFCPKRFSRKYSLTLHRRIHTKERNHVCDVCPKAFRAAIYLTVHKRSHTDERPYECEVCSKAFRTRADLTRHLSKVHHRTNKAPSQPARCSALIATI